MNVRKFASVTDAEAILRENEHGGAGPILFRRILDRSEFRSSIDFVDYTRIPPGSVIGRHTHHGNEEIYFITSGSPLITIDGETKRLSKGGFSIVRDGEWHELVNDTVEDVEILVVQVGIDEAAGFGKDSALEVFDRRTRVRANRSVDYSVLRPVLSVFDERDETFAGLVGSRPLLLVSDLRVSRLYGSSWQRYASRHGLQVCDEIRLDVGEAAKTWIQVNAVCSVAARRGLPRNGVIVGIGGGVVLDTAGMAAAIFRRGIDYVRIPTSLVALVDVAVGIKQGVNAFGKKNLLGAFYPPLASINDPLFLRTLPPREISCGLSEIVKVAALCDPLLFHILEEHGSQLFASRLSKPAEIGSEVIRRAELLMLQELLPNLFEQELARLVDFGHTFSPAMEISSNFEIPHGYAVGFDMLLSVALAAILGFGSAAFLERLVALFRNVGLPVWDDRLPKVADLVASLADVRRHRGGALNLVVISEPGKPRFLQDVSHRELAAAVALLKPFGYPAGHAQTAAALTPNYDRAAF